jgi:GDSL-like Lipase/Acylhydrolase family
LLVQGSAATFFSNPSRVATLYPSGWETSPIGVLWFDNFDRAALGTNWITVGSVNATIVGNELQLSQTNTDSSRQLYYQPWLTCSDHWMIRWTQRFSALNSSSLGVGVGVKNFQAAGGNDVNYNALFAGAGANVGKCIIEKYDGGAEVTMSAGNAISFSAGDTLDCSLARAFWTLTATISNRANAQVSTASFTFVPHVTTTATPPISRICMFPLGGTVIVDNFFFSIERRKPARFIQIGGSASEGEAASAYSKCFVAVVQSNYLEAVCNDSGSWNSVTNAVSLLPEILTHQPGTAILMTGGNDLYYGYPTAQWQNGYSNLVFQLKASGARVKHCLPTPRNSVNLAPLKNFIQANYPAADIIDCWTPLLTNTSSLNPIYDSGDGVHFNDAGHLIIGSIIRTNLP